MSTIPEPAGRLTVAQYEERLIEGDRWIEVVAGRLIRLDPQTKCTGMSCEISRDRSPNF